MTTWGCRTARKNGYHHGEFTSTSLDVEPRKKGYHLQLELHPQLYVLYSFCLQVLTIRVWLSWILTVGLFEKAGMLHLFGILGYCSLVRDTCVFLWWFSWGEKQLSQLHPLFWIVFRVVESIPILVAFYVCLRLWILTKPCERGDVHLFTKCLERKARAPAFWHILPMCCLKNW